MLLNACVIQPWNAADIDADFSEIGHGIYIQAGANSADVEGRRSQIGMRRHVELECFQSRQYAGGFIRGVDAEMRHRSMSSDALQRQAEPQSSLVPDQWRIRGGLRH